MRISGLLTAAVILTVGCTGQDSVATPSDLEAEFARTGPAGAATYLVTVTSLIPAATAQPFTPPIVAIHRKPFHMFQVGQPAGTPIREIAENGNLGPMMTLLGDSHHVIDWAVLGGDPPPLFGGESRMVELHSERGAKYLSYGSMLICTNDGFTGVDGVRLPDEVGETVTVLTQAYDAGSEINTEDFADIVPPCQFFGNPSSGDPGTDMSDPALTEGGVIHHHGGIVGGNDLTSGDHGWTNPVSRVTVERIG